MEVLTPKLSIRNMNKSFDGKTVLNNLNFDLMEGEFLSILGPSGCGKTTLGRAILKLHQPTDGQIIFDGEDITKEFLSETSEHYEKGDWAAIFAYIRTEIKDFSISSK